MIPIILIFYYTLKFERYDEGAKYHEETLSYAVLRIVQPTIEQYAAYFILRLKYVNHI